MDELQVKSVKKRIFNRFSQWYYQGVKMSTECMDAPELVVLLQAAGFSLHSIGMTADTSNKECRVVVQCGASGLRAELSAPDSTACRCSRFSSSSSDELGDVQQQASFWQITSSQDRLNTAMGSSLVPTVYPARQTLINEVLQILQEEMGASPIRPPRPEKRRYSLSSVNRSLESLHVHTQTTFFPAIDTEQRRSSSCQDLVSRLADVKPSVLVDTNHTADSTTVGSSVSSDDGSIRECLNTIVKSATDALQLLLNDSGKKRLTRKVTYTIKDEEDSKSNAEGATTAPKRLRTAATPGPKGPLPKTGGLRGNAGKPPAPLPPTRRRTETPNTDPVRRRNYTSEPSLLPETRGHESTSTDKTRKSMSVFKRLSTTGLSKKKPEEK